MGDRTPKTPNYRIVFLLLGITAVLSFGFAFKPKTQIVVADVQQIPLQFGNWVGEDAPADANLSKALGADTYVNRWYENKATHQYVELLVVYRRYGRREFAHRPEQCFPAAGYNIIENGKTTLPWAGKNVPAIHMRAEWRGKESNPAPYRTLSYIFASGRRTECDFLKQQLVMAMERLVPNKNGWTFIRLQSPRLTNDADADTAQQDFMREIGPKIEEIITTDKEGDARVANL